MNTLDTLDHSTTGRPLGPPARVGLLDRAAMRLGLALVMWGRRHRRLPAPAGLAEAARLREQYERDAAHRAVWSIVRLR